MVAIKSLFTLLPLLAAAPAAAAPGLRMPGSATDLAAQAFDSAQSWIHGAISEAKTKWDAIESGAESKISSQMVVENGIEWKADGRADMALTHPEFPLHRLRVVQPNLCDPNVKQYSGYLDISETKHLFFWFEESRHKPKEDPLVLWLNGGPGCSSTTGLLFELGGCNIADKGENVTYNDFSWNSVANVLFLDQPVGVGYSYSENESINNSPAAAEDVYAFLVLFISQFDRYRELDFHIAGESYAGTYIPNIANTIYKHNKGLDFAPTPSIPKVNLKSVMIGDGVTDPYHQMGTVPEWACESEYAVYDDPEGPECTSLKAKAARCQNLISGCYKSGSRFACVPANLYCYSGVFGGLQDLGLNMYDVRKKCDKAADKDGPLCYKEMGWMETYMNKPEVKKQLGAPADITFQSCNMQINQAFLLQGDGMHNSGALLPELVDDGIRLLLYAGQADMLVNSIGVESVMANLETSYNKAYNSAKVHNFTDTEGALVGWAKETQDKKGRVSFVSFHNAGHMVPHDDPKGALAMFSRWLKNEPMA